jgi:hypothetical protein
MRAAGSAMQEKGMEDANLTFDREKWTAEVALRQRELELQEADLQNKIRKPP